MTKKIFSILAILIMMSGLSIAYAKIPIPAELTLSAKGEISAIPDIVNITLGVTTQEKTANLALKNNSIKMDAIFKALETFGIPKKDIQTSNLNLNPLYTYTKEDRKRRLDSYQVSNHVYITTKDIEQLGQLIDIVVNAGATNVNSIEFSLENNKQILDAARKQAIKKLMEKADLYAKTAGFKIVRILRISEDSYSSIKPITRASIRAYSSDMPASPPPPIAAGSIISNITVNANFEIK